MFDHADKWNVTYKTYFLPAMAMKDIDFLRKDEAGTAYKRTFAITDLSIKMTQTMKKYNKFI